MMGLCLALAISAVASAQPAVPALTGRVVDQADILSPHIEAGLTQRLALFEDSTSAQVVVLTIPSLESAVLEEFATEVFRTWGLGQAEANNGVLLLVARDDRELRIEVGFGLEGDLTDATAGQIIRNVIVPRFKEGDFDSGVLMGVEAILGSIEGTYEMPPEQESADDFFTLVLFCLFPLWNVLRQLRTGLGGSDGDVASGVNGALVGGFFGLAIGFIVGNWWWMLLVLVLPWIAVWLNRALERHPRFGPARRKRRRKARLIRSAQRAGKTSIVIDGVSHRVPSASSSSGGGGFSGGGGSSGGGGASGSW